MRCRRCCTTQDLHCAGNGNPMPTLLGILAPLCLLQAVEYRSPAGVEYRAQRDTGAIARADSALAADPRNVDRIIALGVAQSGVRQFREAIATFTRGLRVAPKNALLYRWRGHRYLSTRQFDRSEERRVGKECRSRWSPY